MKTILQVGAGLAVGLTAAIAVLIEMLQRLFPLAVVVAIGVFVVLRVSRRRTGHRCGCAHGGQGPVSTLPAGDHAMGYLRWGSEFDGGAAAPALVPTRAHVHRSGAGTRPPRLAARRRP